RLADDLQVQARLEDHAEAPAYERLVVHEQDADQTGCSCSSGSLARTLKPPPPAGPASTSPPRRAARSRIPIRPCPPPVGAPATPSATTSSPRPAPVRRTVTSAPAA